MKFDVHKYIEFCMCCSVNYEHMIMLCHNFDRTYKTSIFIIASICFRFYKLLIMYSGS